MSHALFEGEDEGAITSETAAVCQFLDGERTAGGNCLTIEADEMIDAQIVDIGIVGDALAGEILAEIGTVCTNSLGKLGEGQVVLQVELRVYAMLL